MPSALYQHAPAVTPAILPVAGRIDCWSGPVARMLFGDVPLRGIADTTRRVSAPPAKFLMVVGLGAAVALAPETGGASLALAF